MADVRKSLPQPGLHNERLPRKEGGTDKTDLVAHTFDTRRQRQEDLLSV